MHLRHTDHGSLRESELFATAGQANKLIYLWKVGNFSTRSPIESASLAFLEMISETAGNA